MELGDALAWLDRHVDMERATRRLATPTLERMQALVALMDDPQRTYPVIHVTGTNGKGSTARMISALLEASGLSVGLFTSPHLERLNERIARNREPIGDRELAELLTLVASVEQAAPDLHPSWFELVTAAALRWFSDVAVDVAVVEVGILGRWDATNVVEADVAVVTNVGLDHTEYAGPTRADIAREKAGIVPPGGRLVLGETDPDLAALFTAEGPGVTWARDLDFDCVDNRLAVGGRLVTLRTPMGTHVDLHLPLHGAHQGDNAAAALAAVELFFDRPLDDEVIQEGLSTVTVPGRMEVVGRQPLVLLDGAHNVEAMEAAAEVLSDDFATVEDRILVVGMLAGRDPEAMLGALDAPSAKLLVACTPPSPRALPASEVAKAAVVLDVPEVVAVPDVDQALARALAAANEDELVLVTGSLYTVGAARPWLLRRSGRPLR